MGHVLAGHRADHVRAGYVHLADAGRHEDEVRQSRGVGRPASSRTENHRDLGYNAGCPDVLVEDCAVSSEAVYALLDTGAAGVDQAHDWRPSGRREVHYLAYLLGDHLRQGAAEHGEVLGIDECGPAVDLAVSGYDGVSEVLLVGEAEIGGAVYDEGVDLLEGALVEKKVDALSRSQLAPAVLGVNAPLTAAEHRLLAHLAEL